jgi:hypothetical protein
MTLRRRKLISALLVTVGIVSAIFIGIEANPNVIIPGWAVGYDVELSGNYAFVSNNDGVVVIDISNNKTPTRKASIDLSEGAFGLHIDDDLLYVAGTSDGLVIVDISNPLAPAILGSQSAASAYNVFVSGIYAYVVVPGGTLEIVDVTNSSDPLAVGTLSVGSRGNDVAVVGNIAYYANPERGLVVIDVSNPSSPDITRTLPYSSNAWDISIHDDILYLGRHGSGLSIFNISSPTSPSFLGSFNDGGEVYGVSGNGTYLVAGDLQEGTELLDVTDPENPVLITKYANSAPHAVYYNGVCAYAADQDRELIIVDFHATEVNGYIVHSPNSEWLWAIPILLLSVGIFIIIHPYLRENMKNPQ